MMQPFDSSITDIEGVGLSIGAIEIMLHIETESLRSMLSQRYQDFPLQSEPIFHVRLKALAPSRSVKDLDDGWFFTPDGARFDAPGWEGMVTLRKRQAYLEVSLPHPIEAVDYFLRVLLATLAFEAGGFLFHSAGIVRHGLAYLFFGHSGSGKTTVSRLSAGAEILSDDLVLLLPSPGGWESYATPFTQTQAQPLVCMRAPVGGLYRLVKSKAVFLEQLSEGQALAELTANVPVIPRDPQRSQALLARLLDLVDLYPIHRLHFLPDQSFWQVILPGSILNRQRTESDG